MTLDNSTIELIQGSSSSKIVEEFLKWLNGDPVERTFQKAFNDINSQTSHALKVIIVALKIFMDEYEEEPRSTINITVEY